MVYSLVWVSIAFQAIATALAADNFAALEFEYVSETEDFNGVTRDIGWFKFLSCEEGNNDLVYQSGYTLAELVDLARYAITVKIIPSSKLPTDSNSDDFSVKADMCSNPIYAFNNGYEMSYFLDMPSSTVSGQASLEEWIGTDAAKARLTTSCDNVEATPLTDGDVYHACGYGAGIHILAGSCWWALNENLGEDVTVWMGFDADKAQKCDFDDSGAYQLYEITDADISGADSCLQYTFGFKTDSSSWATSSAVHTITLFLNRNEMYQCEVTPSGTSTWHLCTADGAGTGEAAYAQCDAAVHKEIGPSFAQPVIQISNPVSDDNSGAVQVKFAIANKITGLTQFQTLATLYDTETIGPSGARYRQYFLDNSAQHGLSGLAPEHADSVPVCDPLTATSTLAADASFIAFGIKTCSREHSPSGDEFTLSLYWDSRMYQCTVVPNIRGQWFLCQHSSTDDIECHTLNRVIDYALQVSSVKKSSVDDVCIDDIYVQEVENGVTVSAVQLNVANEVEKWIGDSYGNSMSDPSNVLYGPISSDSTETCNTVGVYSRGVDHTCYHSAAVVVMITACDDVSYSSTSEETLKLQLFGEGGTSRFVYVNSEGQTSLPGNGESKTYTLDNLVSDDFGELYRVKIALDDSSHFCIHSLSVSLPAADSNYDFSASDYFGAVGMYLSNACGGSFINYDVTLTSGRYIPCFDDFVTLNTYEARSVIELTVHSCIGDESGTSSSVDTDLYAAIVGRTDASNHVSELVRLDTYLLSSQDAYPWLEDFERVYHLSLASYMDEVVVVSITNENAEDELCIDEVLIDDTSAFPVSHSSTNTMNAILIWVSGMRDYLPRAGYCDSVGLFTIDYFPPCKADGTYDGCQCDRDDTVCWCVDSEGNKLGDASSMAVEEGVLWQEVCVNKLQCADSDVNHDNYLSSLGHSMDCATAQKLAIYKGDEYMPQCRIGDSTAYDGCQCALAGNSANRRRCWCVTNEGANINGKAKEVRHDEGMSNEQICVEVLQCEDSDVVYAAAVEVEPPSNNVYNGFSPQDLYDSVKLLSLVSVAIFLSAVVVTMVFMCQKCMGRRQSSKVEAYDFVAFSDDEQRALK